MKKKILAMVLIAMMLLAALTACGGSDDTKADDNTQEKTATETNTNETKEKGKDFPEDDYSDMGAGEMYLSTAGGTSEDGNIPVIFVEDEILIQIGINTSSFDGSKLSYIYIDGILNSKEQLADSQQSIDLTEDDLTIGTHKVEVVQYDSDESDGSIVTYKTASYEIKSK